MNAFDRLPAGALGDIIEMLDLPSSANFAEVSGKATHCLNWNRLFDVMCHALPERRTMRILARAGILPLDDSETKVKKAAHFVMELARSYFPTFEVNVKMDEAGVRGLASTMERLQEKKIIHETYAKSVYERLTDDEKAAVARVVPGFDDMNVEHLTRGLVEVFRLDEIDGCDFSGCPDSYRPEEVRLSVLARVIKDRHFRLLLDGRVKKWKMPYWIWTNPTAVARLENPHKDVSRAFQHLDENMLVAILSMECSDSELHFYLGVALRLEAQGITWGEGGIRRVRDLLADRGCGKEERLGVLVHLAKVEIDRSAGIDKGIIAEVNKAIDKCQGVQG